MLFYVIEKSEIEIESRTSQFEKIMHEGSEIECQRRMRELRKAAEADSEARAEYFVVLADEYEEKHKLKEARNIMEKFNETFGRF